MQPTERPSASRPRDVQVDVCFDRSRSMPRTLARERTPSSRLDGLLHDFARWTVVRTCLARNDCGFDVSSSPPPRPCSTVTGRRDFTLGIAVTEGRTPGIFRGLRRTLKTCPRPFHLIRLSGLSAFFVSAFFARQKVFTAAADAASSRSVSDRLACVVTDVEDRISGT